MVEGGMNCIKYLIFAFNLIFFIFGAALFGLGIYVQVALKEYLDFFDSTDVNGPAIVLIVVGLIIFIVAFFGCCGAIKENYCMVITFSVLMGVILLCQVSAAIAGFVLKDNVKKFVRDEMLNSMRQYTKKHEGVIATWNKVQKEYDCCGVSSATDWKKEESYKTDPPMSCCSNSTETCTYAIVAAEQRPGCYDAIVQVVEDNVYRVGAVGISLAIIQVTGIVLACCLARGVRKEYEVA